MSGFGAKRTCPDWWNNSRSAEQHEKLEGQIEFYNSNWDNTPPWGHLKKAGGAPDFKFESTQWPGDPEKWPGFEAEESIQGFNARKLTCMKNRAKFEKVSDAMVRILDKKDADMKMTIARDEDAADSKRFLEEGWNNYAERNRVSMVNKQFATQASVKIGSQRLGTGQH